MKRLLACSVFVCIAPLGGCGDDPITPPTQTSIQGRIEDTDGLPVPGVLVLAGDQSPATSDSEGSFRVDGVAATYDIALLFDSTAATLYAGITRRDPFFRVPPRTPRVRATITGTVPSAPSKRTRLHFGPSSFTAAEANPTTGRFQLFVDWPAFGPTVEGSLFALRWSVGADGLPSEYDGFASRRLVLAPGTSIVQDFVPADFSDPPEAQVNGAVMIPNGYEFQSIGVRMHIGPASFWFFVQARQQVPGTAFEYTLPIIPDAFFALEAFALRGGHHTVLRRNGIVPPAAEISLDLPASPQIVEPADGASNVDSSTVFQWEEGGGTGPYAVFINIYGRPRVDLYLAGTSTRIPDLRRYGFSLPAGAHCMWVVYKLFPLASLDAMLTSAYGAPIEPEAGNAHSAYHTFTTPP